nr:MAG TPA_asm: hypothetical protein [Caudoviricetes sp.]
MGGLRDASRTKRMCRQDSLKTVSRHGFTTSWWLKVGVGMRLRVTKAHKDIGS